MRALDTFYFLNSLLKLGNNAVMIFMKLKKKKSTTCSNISPDSLGHTASENTTDF